MNMKITGFLATLALLTGCATNPYNGGYAPMPTTQTYGYGQVMSPSEAVPGVIVAVRNVQLRRQEQNVGGAVLGGLIGAAIGNQIGDGDGRRAATVAGALVGGAIGANTQGPVGYAEEVVVQLESGRRISVVVEQGGWYPQQSVWVFFQGNGDVRLTSRHNY